ncbi:DUF2630 family protein [Streptomyces sp. NPDC059506]|nr:MULTISPECIES: DUF2630 family protein [unclassified Streptomyces]MCZ2525032.1 DUF2630 family protein [Streptomyces sp. HB2AG]PLW73578.1 DUF2630 domain-containing protein [Streptomyces sp. DJ]QMV24365.1 DUF2630 family protein [Streptomyces sp. SCUT-3]
MAEDDIIGRIDALLEQERALRARAPGKGLDQEERARLQHLEEQLDQCWDLLRRRRARAGVVGEPAEVHPRPVEEVESYEQ